MLDYIKVNQDLFHNWKKKNNERTEFIFGKITKFY